MKRILMMGFLLAAGSAAFAQKDHRVYEFNHTEAAKDVHRYGEAPEFPFLRNIYSSEQFVKAMHQPHGRNTVELNNILKGIGFERGVQDVKLASVAPAYIPEGTVGNMGGAGYNYIYAKLYSDGGGVKAWKVTGDGGSVYFISKCGNAFYADPQASPASAAVMPEEQVILPTATLAAPVCKDKVYIYYGGTRKISRGWEVYADDMETAKCSNPYDQTAVARANEEPAKSYTDMHVERTAEYLGYRKVDDGEYKSEKQIRREERGCGCRKCSRW